MNKLTLALLTTLLSPLSLWGSALQVNSSAQQSLSSAQVGVPPSYEIIALDLEEQTKELIREGWYEWLGEDFLRETWIQKKKKTYPRNDEGYHYGCKRLATTRSAAFDLHVYIGSEKNITHKLRQQRDPKGNALTYSHKHRTGGRLDCRTCMPPPKDPNEEYLLFSLTVALKEENATYRILEISTLPENSELMQLGTRYLESKTLASILEAHKVTATYLKKTTTYIQDKYLKTPMYLFDNATIYFKKNMQDFKTYGMSVLLKYVRILLGKNFEDFSYYGQDGFGLLDEKELVRPIGNWHPNRAREEKISYQMISHKTIMQDIIKFQTLKVSDFLAALNTSHRNHFKAYPAEKGMVLEAWSQHYHALYKRGDPKGGNILPDIFHVFTQVGAAIPVPDYSGQYLSLGGRYGKIKGNRYPLDQYKIYRGQDHISPQDIKTFITIYNLLDTINYFLSIRKRLPQPLQELLMAIQEESSSDELHGHINGGILLPAPIKSEEEQIAQEIQRKTQQEAHPLGKAVDFSFLVNKEKAENSSLLGKRDQEILPLPSPKKSKGMPALEASDTDENITLNNNQRRTRHKSARARRRRNPKKPSLSPSSFTLPSLPKKNVNTIQNFDLKCIDFQELPLFYKKKLESQIKMPLPKNAPLSSAEDSDIAPSKSPLSPPKRKNKEPFKLPDTLHPDRLVGYQNFDITMIDLEDIDLIQPPQPVSHAIGDHDLFYNPDFLTKKKPRRKKKRKVRSSSSDEEDAQIKKKMPKKKKRFNGKKSIKIEDENYSPSIDEKEQESDISISSSPAPKPKKKKAIHLKKSKKKKKKRKKKNPTKKNNFHKKKKEKASKIFTCEICNDFTASSRRGMANHLRVHKKSLPFTCNICTLSFKTKDLLFTHKEKEHKQVIQNCHLCQETFYTEDLFAEHLCASHHFLLCKYKNCDDTQCFPDEESLANHSQNAHSLHCGSCGKSFSNKAILEKHLALHINARAYKCPTCQKGFNYQYVLDQHIKTHEDLQLECEKCHEHFKTQQTYNNHINLSQCGKNLPKLEFECQKENCIKSFANKKGLQKHMWNVHREGKNGKKLPPKKRTKRVKCKFCDKDYSTNSNLNKHIKKDHPEE